MELLDGVLIDLLKTKWNTFVKFRFYQQFYLFACYFLVSLVTFTLRPGPDLDEMEDTVKNKTLKSRLIIRNDSKLSNLSSIVLEDDGKILSKLF